MESVSRPRACLGIGRPVLRATEAGFLMSRGSWAGSAMFGDEEGPFPLSSAWLILGVGCPFKEQFAA